MNEFTLKDAVIEAHRQEIESFDSMPEHRFSLKHRIKMKRILSLLERNIRKIDRPAYEFSFKRALIVVMIILFAALAVTAAVMVIDKFKAIWHTDNTELFYVNPDGAPTEIGENLYRITALPEEFEIEDETLTSVCHDIIYYDDVNGKRFMFSQTAKAMFNGHYDNEGVYFEKTEINGHSALYMEVNKNDSFCNLFVWDNGDYILEISGDLTKNELLYLAESAKVLNN